MEKNPDYSLAARIVFKADGSLTWFGWICATGGAIFAAACLALLGGCINIYTRCPFTEKRIERIYQCTMEAASLSYVVMFPQTMSADSSDDFMPANLISTPIGMVLVVDTAFEAVVDTICLPADLHISENASSGAGCSGPECEVVQGGQENVE